MKPVILFVLGAPGAGKTLLCRALLRHGATFADSLPSWECANTRTKWTVALNDDIVAAGHYTGLTFDGADTIPYSGARAALEEWRERIDQKLWAPKLTILDGARLATRPSLAWLREHAPDHVITGVYLDASEDVLGARRRARGSDQNPTWIKGATARARRFADMLGCHVITADGAAADIAACVRTIIATAAESGTKETP